MASTAPPCAASNDDKERLLTCIRESAVAVLDDITVKLDARGRLLVSGRVDVREATRLRIALHHFRRELPGAEILSKGLEHYIPQVRLRDVTKKFEREVLSERAESVGNKTKSKAYLSPQKHIDLPAWNADFIDAADLRTLRHITPRHSPSDDTTTIEAVARFVADFCEGIVVHTGAGISYNAGIPTYRDGASKSVSMSEAMPTYTHQALVALVQAGKVDYVCSQNVDGLHRKSGLPADRLSELHGNAFMETCSCCSPPREFLRTSCVDEVKGEREFESNVDWTANERASGIRHITGKVCPHGGGPLRDTVIHFNETPPKAPLEEAERRSKAAPLNLVLGTSLLVAPASSLPFVGTGPVVIVSRSCTACDLLTLNTGGMLLRCDADVFMEQLVRHVGLYLPNTTMQHIESAKAEAKAKRDADEATRVSEKGSRRRRRQQKLEQDEARQKALSERPELDVPGPKEKQEALLKLQKCTSDEFQKKHGLKGASGNTLARWNYSSFQETFADFREHGQLQELHTYKGT